MPSRPLLFASKQATLLNLAKIRKYHFQRPQFPTDPSEVTQAPAGSPRAPWGATSSHLSPQGQEQLDGSAPGPVLWGSRPCRVRKYSELFFPQSKRGQNMHILEYKHHCINSIEITFLKDSRNVFLFSTSIDSLRGQQVWDE